MLRHELVRVWLSRKLADVINGIDLRGRRVGDVLELRVQEAMLLLADGYAELDRRLSGERRAVRRADTSPDRRGPDRRRALRGARESARMSQRS